VLVVHAAVHVDEVQVIEHLVAGEPVTRRIADVRLVRSGHRSGPSALVTTLSEAAEGQAHFHVTRRIADGIDADAPG
jgi:hypothetical protein